MKPTQDLHFEADALMRSHPPQWTSENKQTVFDLSNQAGAAFAGELVYRCWDEQSLAAELAGTARFSVHDGVFAYADSAGPGRVEWHLNFADPRLFGFYGSGLMAQDELQVAEHPVLGALYEALQAGGGYAGTVDPQGRPTPVTITGVQRRCRIDTRANPAQGKPGYYGNAFARATAAEVAAITTPLVPPTSSNILAIAAPIPNRGGYSRGQILDILSTAYSGYRAASAESERLCSGSNTVIHTGFWGCGAFGGNKTLMAILQSLAAELAGVDLEFWAFDAQGTAVATDAHRQYAALREEYSSPASLLDALAARRYQWGVSDGN